MFQLNDLDFWWTTNSDDTLRQRMVVNLLLSCGHYHSLILEKKVFFFSKSALNTCVLHLTLISQFFVKSKLMTFPISHLNLDELLCSIIFDQILVKLWIKSPIFDYIILWRKHYYFGCFWGINNNCLDVKSGHPKAEIV